MRYRKIASLVSLFYLLSKSIIIMTMNVIINGEQKEILSTTVETMLGELKLDSKIIVVEKNKEIIERNKYSEISISQNDVFELIRFMGGG